MVMSTLLILMESCSITFGMTSEIKRIYPEILR